MTTPLIALDEAKEWIFATQPEDEPLIQQLITLATGVVLEYVGPDPVTQAARTWTTATVPDAVRAAILTQVAELWAHRGDEPPAEGAPLLSPLGHLSPAVIRFLQRYKEPVIA